MNFITSIIKKIYQEIKEENTSDYFLIRKKRIQISLVLTLIFPLVSTLLGVYIGSKINFTSQERFWKIQFESSKKEKIIDKRIDLLERTIKIFGAAPGMEELYRIHSFKRIPKDNGDFDYIIDLDDKNTSEKLGQYRGEYMSILLLDGCFFGKETKRKSSDIMDIGVPYWSVPASTTEELVNTMLQELYIEYKASEPLC